MRLHRDDVEAFLVVGDHELAEIILTFTLSRDSPSRWKLWEALVLQLCEDWDLGLYDAARGFMVEPTEILHALADTQAWRDFEANFHWPPTA